MFSGADAPWHWLIIAVLVIALFGYKKLPDASRALGRSLRIFKTEIKGLTEDDKARDAAATHVDPEPRAQAQAVVSPPPAVTPPADVTPAPVPASTEQKPAE